MGEGPGAAAFALRELGLCDIKFAERREPGSANGALRVGAGSGLGRANAGGSLCFCESDSTGPAADNSPGPGLAGPLGPYPAAPAPAACCPPLPGCLPPRPASLRPLPPSLPSEHTDESAGRQTAALRASLAGASPPGRGRGCRGWRRVVRGGLGPSGVNPCVFGQGVSPSPPDSPLPLPLLQSIRNISCLAVKKKDAPRMLHPAHCAGTPRQSGQFWVLGGPAPSGPRRQVCRPGRQSLPGWQFERSPGILGTPRSVALARL